jgi:hypothetical protein
LFYKARQWKSKVRGISSSPKAAGQKYKTEKQKSFTQSSPWPSSGVLGLIEFLIFIYNLGCETGGKLMVLSLLKVLDSSLNQGEQQLKAKQKSYTLFLKLAVWLS